MRKLWKKMKNKQGFTLMEMLIVVAIIAVLVAIAIPVYQGQMHKAKVAADMANVRAYYAELQADYLTTGTLRLDTEVPYFGSTQGFLLEGSGQRFLFDVKTIHFLNGQEVTLQAGSYLCTRLQDQNNEPVAYQITYYCNEHHAEHDLTLG